MSFQSARGVVATAVLLATAFAAGCSGGGGSAGGSGMPSVIQPVPNAADPATLDAAAPVGAAVATSSGGEQARASDGFVDSIGINTQFNWGPAHANYPATRAALTRLGIRHLRDGLTAVPLPGYFEHLNDLATAGIHASLTSALGDDPVKDVAVVSRIGASLEAIEAPNEANVGANWAPPLAAFQRALYAAVKANPQAARLAVIGPALKNDLDAYAVLGDLSGSLDDGNMHDYAGGNSPGNGGIVNALAASAHVSGSKPIVATETGYCTSTAAMGVTPAIMGRYVPRMFFEQFNAGVLRTYEYQLLDDNDDAGSLWSQCGLLTHEFAPKPAFTALAGLIALLADPGVALPKTRLNYTLTAPAGVHHTLLQKNNRTFYLALWVEAPGYDAQRHLALSVPARTATIRLAAPVSAVTHYTYDDTGALTGMPLGTTSTTIGVTVTDRLTILKIVP